MSSDNPEDFIKRQMQKMEDFINNDLPVLLNTSAVDHFKENFQKEGFVDNGLQPWPEVKRRTSDKTKGVARTRKILTGESGDLGKSLQGDPGKAELTIFSDLEYAEAHNQGTTTAGRGNKTTIPQRKFIDDSKELTDIIENEMEKGRLRIFGK